MSWNDFKDNQNFWKWNTIGATLEGKWFGTTEGRFGLNGIIGRGSNKVEFSMTKKLTEVLHAANFGDDVEITYLDDIPLNGGKVMKNFSVIINGNERTADDEKAQPVPGDDDYYFSM